MSVRVPLSVRNRNPGNLRYVARIRWLGQEGEGEGGFVRFRTVEHGFRAAARQLMTYAARDGLRTVSGIIGRWAPPRGVDNVGRGYVQSTEGYIRRVCRDLGVGRDEEIFVQDWRVMRALLVSIAEHEAGLRWPFARLGGVYVDWTDAALDEGLRMAGFDVPPAPLLYQPVSRDVALVGGAGVGAVGLLDFLSGLPAVVGALGGLVPWLAALLVLLVSGLVVWYRWERIRLYGGGG